MTGVDGITKIIEKTDRSAQTLSSSRVLLAKNPCSKDTTQQKRAPVNLRTEKATEQANTKDIVAGNDDEDDQERNHNDVQQRRKNECALEAPINEYVRKPLVIRVDTCNNEETTTG